MPLHADDPVFVWLMLDGLDHSIGCNRSNAQAASKIPDGLMMRSVYLSIESAAAMREAASGRELSNFAAGLDPSRMNGVVVCRPEPFPAVLDVGVQFAGDILVERAAESNVETLAAIANREDWLAGGKGVLKDGGIRFLAICIGVMRLFAR